MRLIDADKLMEELDNIVYTRKATDRHALQIVSAIRNAPTVDAVEVVRCKDCKYWELMPEGMHDCINSRGLAYPKTKDYCSYGVRCKDKETVPIEIKRQALAESCELIDCINCPFTNVENIDCAFDEAPDADIEKWYKIMEKNLGV